MICPACRTKGKESYTHTVSKGSKKGMEKCPRCRMFWPPPEDKHEAMRKALNECTKCFRSRLAGQAFTPYVCEGCGKTAMHPNTATPRFCTVCCGEQGICCRCGEEMD